MASSEDHRDIGRYESMLERRAADADDREDQAVAEARRLRLQSRPASGSPRLQSCCCSDDDGCDCQ